MEVKTPSMHPKLYVKVGAKDEINIETITGGLKFLGMDSTPVMTNTYLDNAGTDGSQRVFSSYGKSTIECKFWLHFTDFWDYKLKKREIYRALLTKDKVRLRTDSEGTVAYVYSNSFEIKPVEEGANDAIFSITYDNPSGLKYSLASTLEAMSYEDGNWGLYGLFLPYGRKIAYRFINENYISVYNGSDIAVDPYYQKHDLKIIMKHYGNGFGLTNNTTGKSWKYTGSMTNNDTLILSGINTYKNGNPDSNNTDFGYLTLAPGFNDIAITGATDLDITFDFNFMYLG